MAQETRIWHDLTAARGAGVLVRLGGLAARYAAPAELLAFVPFAGPTGGFKDSLAEGMIRMAEQSGALAPGALVTESGAGAFSLALALAGYRTGHPVVLCVPAQTALARQQQLAEAGARLVLTAGERAACEKRAAALETCRERARPVAKATCNGSVRPSSLRENLVGVSRNAGSRRISPLVC